MFWTHWIRGYAKVFLVIGILASIITGIVLGIEDPFFFIIIPIGVIAVISIVSIPMMISEISVSLDEINRKLGSQDDSVYSKYDSYDIEDTENYIEPVDMENYNEPEDTWMCPKCGMLNSRESIICINCACHR